MTSPQAEGYAHPDFLADTQWLEEHLGDSDIRIVDTDVDTAYQRAHIPGAILIPDNYEKDPATDRVHILPPDKFSQLMESLGIGDDTTVVAYDNSRSLYAGRLWWALSYYGHTKVKVLDGGWRKWLREGRRVSINPPHPGTGVRFSAPTDPSLMISTDQLKAAHTSPGTVVWDVRSRGEYTGDTTRGNRRPGHVPGAVHLEWLELMDPETHTFKPAEDMRRILGAKGITPDKEVAAH